MSVTRSSEVIGAVDAGCDRLVHPSVRDESARAAQRRLVGILLTAPFFVSASIALYLANTLGAATTLAATCATFGAAWLAVLLVAASGKEQLAAAAALTFGIASISAIVAGAGGLASPMSALLLALPLEAYWQRRSPRAGLNGAGAALAVLPLQALLGSTVFPASAAVAGWHWLVPLAYVATLLPRLGGLVAKTSQDEENDERPRLEDIVDAVVIRMAPNGDISDVSAQARETMRLQPELLLGTGLFDRIQVSDRVAYLCALADLRGGATRRKVEVRVRLPRQEDGPTDNYRPFLIELMSNGNRAPVFTALLRENEEVAQLRADLANRGESAEALEIAKGRFLAAVSHELRTPLNAIIGFSDMLLHETFGGFQNPRQKEYVTLVRDSGHHLLEVVNSILDVSRIEAGTYATNPESFRFADAVEMCRSMMNLQAEAKTISLTTQIAPEAGEIHADRRAVQQMLINLVSNAIKFTPSGGQVSVGAKRLGSWLHFWVSDNGIGIADHDLARLGKPFTQVQNDYTRQFEGTGLGLSLVKGLVSLHEGTMSIESAVGEGTTVTISLPVGGPAIDEQPEERGALVALRAAGAMRREGHGSLRKAG
ncbi:sensor histidine kinase [Pseudaminobacter soli (ex Li et al. 2025)]|uniref:sensor histidine kinase n=1 Tax=Pseudaminobacter soli (ex Li et al. 2025) TaxID=1295366 RepID=UPI001FE0570B|nr:HAMP domain-containing sensor histidine kinase [Mesorhizobium soli]